MLMNDEMTSAGAFDDGAARHDRARVISSSRPSEVIS